MKIAIYTCIIGAYDELQQPRVLEDGFDFICYVGRGEKTAERIGVWEIREIPESLGDPGLDSRWPKMHPHLLLPEYECSVWVDGNVALLDGTLYRAARIKQAAGVKYSGVTHPDHYQRLLEYIVPDVVHVLKDGRIVRTGGRELVDLIEKEGYEGIDG